MGRCKLGHMGHESLIYPGCEMCVAAPPIFHLDPWIDLLLEELCLQEPLDVGQAQLQGDSLYLWSIAGDFGDFLPRLDHRDFPLQIVSFLLTLPFQLPGQGWAAGYIHLKPESQVGEEIW